MIDIDGIDLNTVTAGAGFRLLKGFKLPDLQPQYQFRERRIGSVLLPDPKLEAGVWEFPVRVYGNSQDEVLELLGSLAEKRSKIEHLAPRGGVEATLQYPDATDASTLEVYAMAIGDFTIDKTHLHRFKTDIKLTLTHSPYILGPEELLASGRKPQGVPSIDVTIEGAKGTVPGPARLVLDNIDAVPHDFVAASLQWRHADASADLILMPSSFDVSTAPLQGALVAGANQVSAVTPSGTITAGTWTWGTGGVSTPAVAHNVSVAAMQDVVDGVFGPGNVVVSGSPLTSGPMNFTLSGAFSGLNLGTSLNVASLVGGSASQSITTSASPQYVQATYRESWTPILRTDDQVDTGSYQIWAELSDEGDDYDNLLIRAGWSVGDSSSVKRNHPVVVGPSDGQAVWVYLGDAHVQPLAAGDHRWNILIEARAANVANQQVRIKRIKKLPVEHGRMRVQVPPPEVEALVYSDDWEQSSGNATGKIPEIGATYTGAGSGTDFTIDTSGDRLQRTATSDAANTGRVLYEPTVRTNCRATLRVYLDSLVVGDKRGVIVRGTALSHYLMAQIEITGTSAFSLKAVYRVASGSPTVAKSFGSFNFDPTGVPVFVDLDIAALDSGLCVFEAIAYDSYGSASFRRDGYIYLSALATGGTLDDGAIGVYDERSAGTAGTRTFGAARGYVLDSPNSAMFAGRELHWLPDGSVIRESSAGSHFSYAPGQNRSGRPLIGPAGSEGLVNRLALITARMNPKQGSLGEPQRHDWSLYHRPAYLLGAHPQ